MAVILLLFGFGLVTLYSASTFMIFREGLQENPYVLQQARGGALGLAALVLCYRIPYGWWRSLAWPLLAVTWVFLLIPVLPMTEGLAPEVNGARRWVQLPGLRFQPSEVAKLALIIWTAALAVKKQPHFRSLSKGLLPFLLVWGAVLLPVMAEDFSTACLIGILVGTVVFAAGGRIGHFLFLALVLAPAFVMKLTSGFRLGRWQAFLNPESDPDGFGFQVLQSLVAIGSGGLAGVGFGEGRQKFGFLPEPHNDFIFAMIGEEWGFLGVLFVVCLYLTIAMLGFRIAKKAPDLFGELLAIGFTTLILLHAFLHIGVGLGLVPTTGLSLPLVSFGRSNLLVTMASLGILMSIARAQPQGRAERKKRARG
jgi:cell division protein FtsW